VAAANNQIGRRVAAANHHNRRVVAGDSWARDLLPRHDLSVCFARIECCTLYRACGMALRYCSVWLRAASEMHFRPSAASLGVHGFPSTSSSNENPCAFPLTMLNATRSIPSAAIAVSTSQPGSCTGGTYADKALNWDMQSQQRSNLTLPQDYPPVRSERLVIFRPQRPQSR
jgi:hypothetical protein